MKRCIILTTALILGLLPMIASAELAGTVSDDYEPMYTFAEPYGFKLGGAFGIYDMFNADFMDFLDAFAPSSASRQIQAAGFAASQYGGARC